MTRPTHCVEYLRHNFNDKEKLEMADKLASAHNKLAAIKEEKDAAVSTFTEREKTLKLEIGSVSRLYQQGFDMQNVRCAIEYDQPNANEVTIRREDNGEIVKTRPFNESERQAELPLTNREGEVTVIPPEKPEAEAAQVVEESQANVDAYFGQVMCQECEKNFPASTITKLDGRDFCPECLNKQESAPEAETVEVAVPDDEPVAVNELNF